MLGLILGGVSAAASLFGGMSARSDSRAAAAQQIALAKQSSRYIGEEGAENLRRREFQIGQTQSMTQALSAASGLGGVSRNRYMDTMKREHQYETDWMRKSTKSRQKIAKMGGQMAADATIAGGNAAMWQGIGGAVNTLGGLYK